MGKFLCTKFLTAEILFLSKVISKHNSVEWSCAFISNDEPVEANQTSVLLIHKHFLCFGSSMAGWKRSTRKCASSRLKQTIKRQKQQYAQYFWSNAWEEKDTTWRAYLLPEGFSKVTLTVKFFTMCNMKLHCFPFLPHTEACACLSYVWIMIHSTHHLHIATQTQSLNRKKGSYLPITCSQNRMRQVV